MAYYPGHPSDAPTAGRFPQEVSSVEVYQDDIQVDYATNGKLRQRGFYTAPVKSYSIVHQLNSADKTILLNFYATNRFLPFNFYYKPDSTTHTSCMFTAAPAIAMIGGDYWSITTFISEAL